MGGELMCLNIYPHRDIYSGKISNLVQLASQSNFFSTLKHFSLVDAWSF
jgi:hypothetical protein